jgi:ribosomal protein S18 acetylase RimI-like enzyme
MDVTWTGRAGADEIIDALRGWELPGRCGWQLHAGDVGWHLRFEDDVADGTLLAVRGASGALVAVGLLDGPAVLRLATDPALVDDVALARVLADVADERLPAGEAFADGPPQVRWRAELAARGWDADPDPWVHLWRPVGPVDVAAVRGVAAVATDQDVEDRVAVQRAAFEGSSFTVDRWRLMSRSTAYDGDLDLLARDEDGTPVAAATAWSAGPGRCAVVEPMGTHRDHTGRGHGRRLLTGVAAAAARAGASGVAVYTPGSNIPALAAYRRAGFRAVGVVTAMRRAAAG